MTGLLGYSKQVWIGAGLVVILAGGLLILGLTRPGQATAQPERGAATQEAAQKAMEDREHSERGLIAQRIGRGRFEQGERAFVGRGRGWGRAMEPTAAPGRGMRWGYGQAARACGCCGRGPAMEALPGGGRGMGRGMGPAFGPRQGRRFGQGQGFVPGQGRGMGRGLDRGFGPGAGRMEDVSPRPRDGRGRGLLTPPTEDIAPAPVRPADPSNIEQRMRERRERELG